VKLTTHLHLMIRLRMSGDVLVLLLYAFMTWAGKILTYTHLEYFVTKSRGF